MSDAPKRFTCTDYCPAAELNAELEAEVEALHQTSDLYNDEINALKAENARLREAAKAVDDARNARDFWRIHKDDTAAFCYLTNCLDSLAEALGAGDE